MEQSSPDHVLQLKNLLSSIPGITALQIDGFIKAYLEIRAYGVHQNQQEVDAFDAAVVEGVFTAEYATLLEDLTASLHNGFKLIVLKIIVPGQKQEYNHCGLWRDESERDGSEKKSRVRT